MLSILPSIDHVIVMAASLVASWTSGLLLGFWLVLWTFLLLLQLSNDIKLNPVFLVQCVLSQSTQTNEFYSVMPVLFGVIVFAVVWMANNMLFIRMLKCLIGCVQSVLLTSCPFMIVQYFPAERLMFAQILVL